LLGAISLIYFILIYRGVSSLFGFLPANLNLCWKKLASSGEPLQLTVI